MSPVVIGVVVLVVLLIAGIIGIVFLMGAPAISNEARHQQTVNSNLRALVMAQRERGSVRAKGGQMSGGRLDPNLALAAAAEGDVSRKRAASTSRETLEKQLRYARWPITPIQYRLIQFFVAAALLIPAYIHATIFMQILAVFLGPALVTKFLRRAVHIRFEAFDRDYPVLLLSYVSMLKTGMNVIGGLEQAAKGLDEESVVRGETQLLIERLRLGLTEEQAISAFGEDIAHPELELFVQSLILSKRVGGMLSTTLERLAKQVRKRQQFRKQAKAAVGMEQNSLYVIAVIMGLLMIYLGWTAPQLVFPAFTHPLGKKIFQGGLMLIVFGFYWSSRVTDIKI